MYCFLVKSVSLYEHIIFIFLDSAEKCCDLQVHLSEICPNYHIL